MFNKHFFDAAINNLYDLAFYGMERSGCSTAFR
jgi:hypothetical protein